MSVATEKAASVVFALCVLGCMLGLCAAIVVLGAYAVGAL